VETTKTIAIAQQSQDPGTKGMSTCMSLKILDAHRPLTLKPLCRHLSSTSKTLQRATVRTLQATTAIMRERKLVRSFVSGRYRDGVFSRRKKLRFLPSFRLTGVGDDH